MKRINLFAFWVVSAAIVFNGCQTEEATDEMLPDLVAYTNLTLFDGTGSEPIDGMIVVEGDEILTSGDADVIEPPQASEIVDLDGAFVMPGIINGHGHAGVSDGLNYGEAYYNRENILSDLNTYAEYGVTSVVSLGEPGFESTGVRDEQDTEELSRARVFTSGPVIEADTPEEAASQVEEAAEQQVDWIKVRIDDQLGQTEKMPMEVVEAVVDAAGEHDIEVAAHIVEREDAIDAIEAGVSVIAHSVRDRPADYHLVRGMQQNDVCYIPTLTRELSTFVYRESPDFFEDPFFSRSVSGEIIAEMESDGFQEQFRDSEAAGYFEEQLPLARENLLSIHESAVDIVFGTDSGMPTRFPGFFEHLEMEMMAEAGMDEVDILYSATGAAAECMGLNGLGTLERGNKADFVAFEEDPTEDITNTRTLSGVWIAGSRIDEYASPEL